MFILLNGCSKTSKISAHEDNFKNPPASAKPHNWMHAMDENMTKEDLTKDFKVLAEVRIGSVLLLNISYSIPGENILHNSDEHVDLLKHACKRIRTA